jgi:Cu/Zn superoxide dismutase
VYRARRLASFVLGIALLATLALAGSALAQGSKSVTLQLTPSRDSGVTGTATLADVEGGVEVKLNMSGLPEAGVEHINHFHAGGTCADDRAGRTAPVTIPLNSVVAKDNGTGSATTTIKDVTLDELFAADKERFILLHAKAVEGQGVPPGIACADLVRRSGGEVTSTMGGTTMMISDMTSTGGPPILLLTGALLLGASVLSYSILRRRI